MRLSDKEIDRLAEICKGKSKIEIEEITKIYYKQRRKAIRQIYVDKDMKIGNIIKNVLPNKAK